MYNILLEVHWIHLKTIIKQFSNNYKMGTTTVVINEFLSSNFHVDDKSQLAFNHEK